MKNIKIFPPLKKVVSVSLLLSLFVYQSYSQDFGWAKSIGGINTDAGNAIVIDAVGNVYTTGNFSETADFDPGTNTFNLTAIGGADIFVSKLDANGNFLWAKNIGGTGYDFGQSITTDASGNVYITGRFQGTVDFDSGINTFNLTSNGSYDAFILKIDSNGNFLWAMSIGVVNYDIGYSLVTDIWGNVYITGSFSGIVDFDPSINTFNLIGNGVLDVFILKLDSNGNFLWAKSVGGAGYDYGYSITTDTLGEVYITGSFSGLVDFDPGVGTVNYNTNNYSSYDAFILKLDTTGNFLWAQNIGGIDNDYGFSISTDASGNVYTTGSFSGIVDFDFGTSLFNLTSNGLDDAFLLKLDSYGNFLWAKKIGGAGNDFGNSITIDTFGNLFVTGAFVETVDFDPGIGFNYLSSNFYSYDIFIVKLDSIGDFLWAQNIGGTTDFDNGTSVAVDSVGSVYITGAYEGVVDFDFGTNTFNLTSSSTDIFILKLNGLGVGIEENNAFNFVNLYPNPSSDKIQISSDKLITDITVYNIQGKEVLRKNSLNRKLVNVNVSSFPNGLYYIKVKGEKYRTVKQLVIE